MSPYGILNLELLTANFTHVLTYTVDPPYNDTGSNDNLLVTIECYGIDYFVREITIAFLFRLSLGFRKNFVSFVRELL